MLKYGREAERSQTSGAATKIHDAGALLKGAAAITVMFLLPQASASVADFAEWPKHHTRATG